MSEEEPKPFFEKIFEDLIKSEGNSNSKAAFDQALKYFHSLNETLKNGTEEEKTKAMKEFIAFKKRLEDSVKKLKEKTGMSDEQIKDIMRNQENYKPEDWEIIQESVEELKSMQGLPENLQKNLPKEKEQNKKKKKKKDSWMKS